MPASRESGKPSPAGRRLSAAGLLTALILLIAFLLRVVRLGSPPLWIDELDVFWNSGLQRGPVEIILHTLRNCFEINTNEQMPFQYAWLNGFLRLYQALGIEPGAALVRLPFTLLGFLSLAVLVPAVRRWYGGPTALWTLGLGAVSFFHVYQSRDATSYNALLFFLALHAYGLSGYGEGVPDGGRHRLALIAGTVGMLMSHLTAWFFLAPEGLLWLGRAMVRRVRSPAKKPWRAEWVGGDFEPVALLVLCALPFLIVVYRAATVFRAPGLKEDVEVTAISWPFLRYQLAHFGWGRGHGRLAGFVLVLGGGLAALVREPRTRRVGRAHLALLVIPPVLLFLAPHARIFPRYLTVAYFPLIVLAGRGMAWWSEQLGSLLRGRPRLAWVPSALLAALVAGLQVRPMATLFTLRAKLMAIPQLVEWLETQLPENGLYVWQSGYNLRDVPQGYPVRGRQAAWATMHSGSIKAQAAAEQWGPFARSIFQRFPLAAFLATDFPEPPASGPWAWIGTDFARREVIRNMDLEELYEYGFSPHGVVYPANVNVVCYYNRPEDLVSRRMAEQQPFLVYPEGLGWQYLQTREGFLFASPHPAGRLRVANLTGRGQTARLEMEGAAQAAGALRVSGPSGAVLTKDLQPANHFQVQVGPFSFPPGEQEVRVEFWPARAAALWVFSFRVAPDEPKSEL